jgi:hypothetical protein
MIGTIVLSPLHRGDLYQEGSASYALLKGQAISRSTYKELSAVWPSGFYGSTDTSMVLPDFNSAFLRGYDQGAGNDPEYAIRPTWSGVSPSGTELGSYQLGALKAHEHASGVAPTRSTGGPDSRTSGPIQNVQAATMTIFAGVTQPVSNGTTDQTLWQPFSYKVYPYIRVS